MCADNSAVGHIVLFRGEPDDDAVYGVLDFDVGVWLLEEAHHMKMRRLCFDAFG